MCKLIIRGVSKKFGEWYQKTNKTEDTNKLTLLAFKIIAILHNTLFATFIKLLETVSKGLCRNRSQNHCHAFLDCRHLYKTCAFHDALQVEKQKEVRRRQIRIHPFCEQSSQGMKPGATSSIRNPSGSRWNGVRLPRDPKRLDQYIKKDLRLNFQTIDQFHY